MCLKNHDLEMILIFMCGEYYQHAENDFCREGKRMIFRNWPLLLLFAAVFLFAATGCVESAPQIKETVPAARAGVGPSFGTLAVLPFENNSVTDTETYEPLRQGLAAMLITDLQNNVSALKVIERQKIQNLLKEIALSQSGAVAQSTALQAGKVLGAQAIAIGSFMVLGKQVRIDTRIISVETSEIIMADAIVGSSDAFIDLERKLAEKIAGALNVALRPPQSRAKGNISAALLFSRGVEAFDRGKTEEADTLFQQAISLDPAYRVQVESVKGRQ
jgi:TolB-like protein